MELADHFFNKGKESNNTIEAKENDIAVVVSDYDSKLQTSPGVTNGSLVPKPMLDLKSLSNEIPSPMSTSNSSRTTTNGSEEQELSLKSKVDRDSLSSTSCSREVSNRNIMYFIILCVWLC